MQHEYTVTYTSLNKENGALHEGGCGYDRDLEEDKKVIITASKSQHKENVTKEKKQFKKQQASKRKATQVIGIYPLEKCQSSPRASAARREGS
jgi:hypothetical protein